MEGSDILGRPLLNKGTAFTAEERRAPRLRGAEYDAFVEAFVAAVTSTWPEALLQWEDFKQHNAIALLDRYRHRLPCFNDDIQGTAAMVTAGILAALKARDEPLAAQRLVLLGAGAAGTGIASLIGKVARAQDGGTGAQPLQVMLDSRGLVFEGRDHVDPDKSPFALPAGELARLGFAPARRYDLETVVRRVAPTILIGTSGTRGAFTRAAITAMAEQTPVPIVFPLSNPTDKSEATPADVLEWTQGRALVATGSPFAPVTAGGRAHLVRLGQGALYPPLADLRSVSRAIAVAIASEALTSGVAGIDPKIGVEDAVEAQMWTPEYQELNHDD